MKCLGMNQCWQGRDGEVVQGGQDYVVRVAGLELNLGSCPIIKHPFELGQVFSSCPFSVLCRALPVPV